MLLFKLLSGVMQQLREFVSSVEDEAYVRPLDVLNGASLGQHTRHVLEFYLCLLEGLKSNSNVVNYGNRRRDPLLETDRGLALRTLLQIENHIQEYRSDRSLSLCYAEASEKLLLPSSLHREYAFNIEHSVHHMALLRIGAREACPSLSLGESFGIAQETLAYSKLTSNRA